jgi:predicted AlkP superfamily pyrophosphatase or phosphodiesterase
MKSNDQFLNNSHLLIIPWGIFMHVILLWGVMDSNFHSPIISGLSVIPMPKQSPAKRVFIFVADGLRYRTFKNNTPPYLKYYTQQSHL